MSQKIPETMWYELLRDEYLEELRETGIQAVAGTQLVSDMTPFAAQPLAENLLPGDDVEEAEEQETESAKSSFIDTLESCLRWNGSSAPEYDPNCDQECAFPGYPRVSEFVLGLLATSFPMTGMTSAPLSAMD